MLLDSLPRPNVRDQARSTAKRLRSASEQWPRAPSCVARKTTRGAWPASSASCQRGAQRHQRSPGFRPRKPNSGIGVERSLPRDFENSRNGAVMTAQTVWLPMSSRPVSQQPSRKNPVMGFIEQTSSRSPSTLRGALRRPPPPPPSSLRMPASITAVVLGCGACVWAARARTRPVAQLPPCLSGAPPQSGRWRERSARALDQASCPALCDRFLCGGAHGPIGGRDRSEAGNRMTNVATHPGGVR